MILYALWKILLFIVNIIMGLLNSIPAINEINQSIEPYIQAISNLITNGMSLISFFLPMGLIRLLIPIVITIEVIMHNLDAIRWVIKKIIGR